MANMPNKALSSVLTLSKLENLADGLRSIAIQCEEKGILGKVSATWLCQNRLKSMRTFNVIQSYSGGTIILLDDVNDTLIAKKNCGANKKLPNSSIQSWILIESSYT